mmetsp:Transcript_4319/g.10081  ORF Transcript_4319/g.10081 Transcript_4319/m.10081 type:complete len:213 (+) Transcript_4319:735-1373(+)
MRKRSLGHFSERQNQQGLDPPNEYPEPVRASKSDGISPSTATQMMKATKAETLILDTAIQITRRWKGLQRLTVTTAERARESAKTTLRPAATTITTIVIIELFLKLGVADGIPPWQLLTQCSGTSNFTVTSLIRSADASIVARIGAVVACCAFYDNIYRSRFISSRVIVWKSRILSLYAKPSQAKWRMRIRCIYHRVGDKSNITPKENGRIQ